jgi:hypothetical protein
MFTNPRGPWKPRVPLPELARGWAVPGRKRVDRTELAAAIEKWGVFRWDKHTTIQLQIWTTDRDLAERLCLQYRRKFYECRVTRPYLRPAELVFPVTFSRRGTAAVLIWCGPKFCDRHREIARWVYELVHANARFWQTGRAKAKRGGWLLFWKRRRNEAYEHARAVATEFWKDCPLSLYGEWLRVRDYERSVAP